MLSLFLFLALFVWRTSNRTRVYKYTCTLHAFVYTRGGLHVPPVHMHKAIRAHSPLSVRFIGARFSHLSVSLFLSHPYPSVLARPVSFLQARSLALSLSLLPSFIFLSVLLYAEETHTSAASMQLRFPISVIRTRQNRSTPCRCNGVIQERAFTPARA